MVAKPPPEKSTHADEVRAATPATPPVPATDRAEIVRAVRLIVPAGAVTEARILDATTRGDRFAQTYSGYFDDAEALAHAVAELVSWRAAYFIPNEINPALLARAANRIRPAKKEPTTSDGDITRRRFLPIDTDPVRPSGISATDDEHTAAIERAQGIFADLTLHGWDAPIVGDSSNGGHLLYAIDLPAEDAGLVARCLEALSRQYSDAAVKVDTTVFNPARIWKLYGTVSRKGDNTPERPHRLSRIILAPPVLATIGRELLEELAAKAPQVEPEKSKHVNGHRFNGEGKAFDLAEWLRANNVPVNTPADWSSRSGRGLKWTFDVCPWNDAHTGRCAFVAQAGDGTISAGCHHESCKWEWADLREKFEPFRRNGNALTKAAKKGPDADAPAAETEGIRPVLKWASDVEVKRIEWLWERKLALGKINLICGEPGVSKSTLTTDLTARVTTCSPMPDGTPGVIGSVIIASAEDDQSDTIVPRLKEAGADLSKVVFLDGITLPGENGIRHERSFTLEHIAILADTIKSIGDCKLVVIDPVSAFLADADSHKNAEIRGLLAPLSKLAAEFGVCILLVTHLNKAAGGKAINRAMGSLAFVAAARSAWLVAKDQHNERRRLFLPIKNNIGNDTDGMAFGVIGDDVPRIAWEHDRVHLKADEALASPEDDNERRTGPAPAVKNAAIGWLRELLADGPLESAKVKEEAKAAMIAWSTVRRAQEDIGVKPYKCQFGGAWMWKLPPEGPGNQLAHEDAHVTPTQKQHEQHEQHEHL